MYKQPWHADFIQESEPWVDSWALRPTAAPLQPAIVLHKRDQRGHPECRQKATGPNEIRDLQSAHCLGAIMWVTRNTMTGGQWGWMGWNHAGCRLALRRGVGSSGAGAVQGLGLHWCLGVVWTALGLGLCRGYGLEGLVMQGGGGCTSAWPLEWSITLFWRGCNALWRDTTLTLGGLSPWG